MANNTKTDKELKERNEAKEKSSGACEVYSTVGAVIEVVGAVASAPFAPLFCIQEIG